MLCPLLSDCSKSAFHVQLLVSGLNYRAPNIPEPLLCPIFTNPFSLVPLSVFFQIDGEATELFNLTSDTEFNSVKSLSVGRVQGEWWLCSSEICPLWTCSCDLCNYILSTQLLEMIIYAVIWPL